MLDEVRAAPSSKTELDAIALIGWIHRIQAQPRAERDLDTYAELMRQLCRARHAVLVQLGAELQLRAQARVEGAWRIDLMPGAPDGLLPRAARAGFAHEVLPDAARRDCLVVAVRIEGEPGLFLALELAPTERHRVNEVVMRALLAADLGERRAGDGGDAALMDMLGLVTEVMQHVAFLPAALALVNGLVARYALSFAALVRVTAGEPLPGLADHAELRALSHLDRFDRSSDFVRRLEQAALDVVRHGRPVHWHDEVARALPPPASADGTPGLPALPVLPERLLALPLHDEAGAIRFVMLLAGGAQDLPQPMADRIQFGLDILEPRLQDLLTRDLGPLRRAYEAVRRWGEDWLGPDYLGWKLGGLGLFLLLFISLVLPWSHRVDAAAELTTDATRVLAAQFDGHVDQVHATVGDTVEAGALLASLDKRDLVQQRMESLNELRREEAEAGKARAAGALADAEIGDARADEARARIAELEELLAEADSVAPFKGVIVEGERRDLLNAPMHKGDKIFRIAKVENLYLTLLVPERDIRDVAVGAHGVVALLSRPDEHIGFHVQTINPVGLVKGQDGNQFQVRAQIDAAAQAWWRPGMTGEARIEAGRRTVFWILTHHLIDTLRLKFML